MQTTDFYELSDIQRDLIKGISSEDLYLVKRSLVGGASAQTIVDLYMIGGFGARIFKDRYSMMSLALEKKNLGILKTLVTHGASADDVFREKLEMMEMGMEPGEDEEFKQYVQYVKLL